jgi:hypothetical protein
MPAMYCTGLPATCADGTETAVLVVLPVEFFTEVVLTAVLLG